jgi:hypothetical protein
MPRSRASVLTFEVFDLLKQFTRQSHSRRPDVRTHRREPSPRALLSWLLTSAEALCIAAATASLMRCSESRRIAHLVDAAVTTVSVICRSSASRSVTPRV